jgi:pimeloyl-ACP methyl ester carboxylesterase
MKLQSQNQTPLQSSLKRGAARPLLLSRVLFCAAAVCACNGDAPTAVRPSVVASPRFDAGATIYPPLSANDPGINPYDTWVSQVQTVAETTMVNSTQPFDDPNTGAPVTSATIGSTPQTVNVTAGYGYNGQIRITEGFEQSNGLETVWSQRVGDVTVDRTGAGTLNTQPLESDPLSELGSLQYAQIDPTGGGGSPPPPPPPPYDSCATMIDPSMCFAASRAPTGIPAPIGASRPVSAPLVAVRGTGALTPPTRVIEIGPSQRRVVEELPVDLSARSGASVVPRSQSRSFAALPGALATQSASDDAKWSQQVTRDYEKKDGEWQLKHQMYETFVEHSQGKARHAMHFTVQSRQFHRNAELDAKRAKLRRQMDSVVAKSLARGVGPAALPSLDLSGCNVALALIPCDDPGSGSPAPIEPPAPDQTIVQPIHYNDAVSSGKTLVLEHGFFSDGRTWNRMRPWLKTDMVFKNLLVQTTTWWNLYEDQAAELHRDIADSISSQGAILIGHSNGGMISRSLARDPLIGNKRQPTRYVPPAAISGVITIGTPHWGAPMAKHLNSINRLFRWGGDAAILMCGWSNTYGCQNFSYIANSTLRNIFVSLAGPVAVMSQMQPRSAYHTQVNGLPETSFGKYGIESYLWKKWLPWRLYGDAFCYEDSPCGGSAQVKKIDKIYHHDISCSITSGLLFNWRTAAKCAADAVFLRAADNLYGGWVEWSGDGIVPGWSQRYPNIPTTDIFQIFDGPAHWGETSDKRVGQRVESILNQHFGVGQVSYTPGPPVR